MNRTELLIQSIASLIKSGSYKNALVKMGEFEKANSGDRLYKFYKPGFMIDIGSGLKDEAVIREGISIGETLLQTVKDDKTCAYLHYCLANGYSDLFEFTERTKPYVITGASLQKR